MYGLEKEKKTPFEFDLEQELRKEISDLKNGTSGMFKVVFERLDAVEVATPALSPNRKKIGLKIKN